MNGTGRAHAAWSLWRRFRKSLSPHTIEDIDIVFSIDSSQETGRRLTMGKLVKIGIASRNTVLRRVGSLLRRNMIAAESPSDDRRYRELTLTNKGKALVRSVADKLKQLGRSINARV